MQQHSSFVDVATRRKDRETRANSVVDHERRRRAIQLRGTKAKMEREKEIKAQMEKGRAAAWAWYQYGKGGKERVLSSSLSGGRASTLSTVREYQRGNKSSRFRTEALETLTGHPISPPAALGHLRGASGHRRTGSGRSWGFSNVSVHRTSSLFDSHELESVSKLIDVAVQRNGSTFSNPTTAQPTAHQSDRGSSTRRPHEIRCPPPMRPPARASAHYVIAQARKEVIAISHGSQVLTAGRSPKVAKGSSFRTSFPRYSCRSASDVVTYEEMSLADNTKGVNHRKNTRANDITRDRVSWNPGRIARVYSLPRV